MKEVINFIKANDVEKTNLYSQLKCTVEEAKILQFMSKEYVNGRDTLGVIDILGEFYDIKSYKHLEKLDLIKSFISLSLAGLLPSKISSMFSKSSFILYSLFKSSITCLLSFFLFMI